MPPWLLDGAWRRPLPRARPPAAENCVNTGSRRFTQVAPYVKRQQSGLTQVSDKRRQAASSMAKAAVSALTWGSIPTLLMSWVTVPSTSASTQAAR